MRNICTFIVVSAGLLASDAYAQKEGFDASGYMKYLLGYFDTPSSGSYVDHLLHGRMDAKWYASDEVTAAAGLRARAYYGGSVERNPDFVDQIRTRYEFTNLDAVLWGGGRSVGYAEIDRLWGEWNEGDLQLTAGRQRIAMGTALIWNPTDIFNPYSVLDFDYEERPAVDAVRVQYYTGAVSKAEVDIRPGRTVRGTNAAVGISSNEWNYDFHLLFGRRDDRWLVGGSWAGDVLGGGFRGEILATRLAGSEATAASGPRLMVSGVLSGDYTFPSSVYLHTELLYNNEGVLRNAALFRPEAQILGLLSPARWSIYLELSYNLDPLVRGSLFMLRNPADHSAVSVPSLTWSAMTNLDISLYGLLYSGGSGTEFGNVGSAFFLRGKLSI